MRTKGSLDPQRVPRSDQGGGTKGESPNWLVRPAHKFAKSLTETSSIVCEPLTYDEASWAMPTITLLEIRRIRSPPLGIASSLEEQ